MNIVLPRVSPWVIVVVCLAAIPIAATAYFLSNCHPCQIQIVELAFGKAPPITSSPPVAEQPIPKEQVPVPVPATRPTQPMELPKERHAPTKQASAEQPSVLPPDSPPIGYGHVEQTGINWKTVVYGTQYVGPLSGLDALRNARIRIDGDTIKLLNARMPSGFPAESSVVVVRVTPHDLGFEDEALLKDIVKVAYSHGLKPFPLEAVPAAVLALPKGKRRYFFGLNASMRGEKYSDVLAMKPHGRECMGVGAESALMGSASTNIRPRRNFPLCAVACLADTMILCGSSLSSRFLLALIRSTKEEVIHEAVHNCGEDDIERHPLPQRPLAVSAFLFIFHARNCTGHKVDVG